MIIFAPAFNYALTCRNQEDARETAPRPPSPQEERLGKILAGGVAATLVGLAIYNNIPRDNTRSSEPPTLTQINAQRAEDYELELNNPHSWRAGQHYLYLNNSHNGSPSIGARF